MRDGSTVWDLGEIDTVDGGAAGSRGARVPRATASGGVRMRPSGKHPVRRANGVDWVAGLAMVAPGAPGILRGNPTHGLFFLSSFGLVAALGWAVFATLDRLAPTLVLFGLPPESAIWSLGALLAIAIVLHLASIATASPAGLGAPAPPVSAAASALLPGWGQLLNGEVARAMLFATAAWAVAGAWLAASPWLQGLLASRGLVLPPVLEAAAALPVRAAGTATVWALAVHDAWERASRIREA